MGKYAPNYMAAYDGSDDVPLQVIGTKSGVPAGGEGDGLMGDATHLSATSRLTHHMPPYDVYLHEMRYVNWRFSPSAGGEVATGNPIDVKCAIEPDGAVGVITLSSGGNRVATIASDGEAIFTPAAPVLLAGGSVPHSRQRVLIGNTAHQWPVNRMARGSTNAGLGESDNQFGTGAGTDQVDAVGTFGNNAQVYSFTPAILLGKPADGIVRPAWMIVGDSLQGPSGADGTGTYGDAKGNYGYMERWIDNKVAFVNCSRSTSRLQYYAAGHAKLFANLQYCHGLAITLGPNDWSTGRTSTQMLADLDTLIKDAKAVNPKLMIAVATSTPKVTATANGYVDGGTTASAGNSHREAYNADIRNPNQREIRKIDILLDAAKGVEDPARPGFFKPSATALTTDGSHLSLLGNQLAVADFGQAEVTLAFRK